MTIPGAIDVKLQRQNGTNETTTAAAAPTTAAPTPAAPTTAAPVPSPVPAPVPAPAPVTDSMPELSAGQIHCPCPTRTCFTTITSTGNNHRVQCGSNSFDVACGGPLMGSKLGIIINIIDVFEHNLCTTNTYVTLIHDLVWMCRDQNVGASDACETATLMTPTGGSGGMTTASADTTTGETGTAVLMTTTASSGDTTTGASADTTTAASVTTTTAASADTTTAASAVTTTAGSATTTTVASVTTTTSASAETTTTASG